jgi:hypothetical protein
VAEHLQLPLYYTNAATIRGTINEIEEKLQMIFDRINRWNAILLMSAAENLFMARSYLSREDTMVTSST